MKKNPFIILIFAFIALFVSCEQTTESPPINFVLIMADDLGYGDLSCYGSQYIQTPNIDNLAQSGIRFTDYHSNGAVCSPTRAALLTGFYQQRVGIPGVVYTWLRDSAGLSPEVETLGEIFQNSGYKTGLFGKWHLGYQTKFNPIVQGFDEFKGFVAGNVDYHSHLDNQLVFDWWEGQVIKEDSGYSTDLITGYGVDFIQRNQHQPFFLYLPYAAPHDPYQGRNDEPIRLIGQENRKVDSDSLPGIYKEMVEVLDEGIGKIVKTIADLGLEGRTMVIFCSDNGANKNGSNGVLRGFKGGVYEGGHRVPAIIKYPGKINEGSVSNQTILSMDILPTLIEIAEIPMGNRQFDGKSFANVILKGDTLKARDLFWSYQNKKAMRRGNWKLVSTPQQTAIFDLSKDIEEANDLSDQEPELKSELQQVLEEWEKSF